MTIAIWILLAIYGIGCEITSGFCTPNGNRHDEDAITKIHGGASAIGFMTLLVVPLLLAIMQFHTTNMITKTSEAATIEKLKNNEVIEMTELEKIAYAKSFIDKLANGINPLDDTPIPEDDIANNVRLSRCFFYVSGILQKEIDRERRKSPKENKPERLPFSITQEQLKDFGYSPNPLSATAVARKINWLVREDIEEKKIEKLSYRKITKWLLNIGMVEYREWEDGKIKRFPTAEGEAIGLVLADWDNYGRRTPVIYFTEEAQRFIIDNIDAVIATEAKKGKTSYPWGTNNEETDD